MATTQEISKAMRKPLEQNQFEFVRYGEFNRSDLRISDCKDLKLVGRIVNEQVTIIGIFPYVMNFHRCLCANEGNDCFTSNSARAEYWGVEPLCYTVCTRQFLNNDENKMNSLILYYVSNYLHGDLENLEWKRLRGKVTSEPPALIHAMRKISEYRWMMPRKRGSPYLHFSNGSSLKSVYNRKKDKVFPQMDGGDPTSQGIDNLVSDKSETTILSSSTAVESTLTEATDPLDLSTFCTSEDITTLDELTRRWILFDRIELKTTNKTGDLIYDKSLLKDFWGLIYSQPNGLILKQHALFRTDLKIMVVTNSNKFNQGREVVTYIPGDYVNQDRRSKTMSNMRSALVREHVIIDLNSSNKAEITIPYIQPYPFLHTNLPLTETYWDSNTADLARLQIYCLSPFVRPDTGASVCKISLYLKFENLKVSGIRHLQSSVVPQGGAISSLAGPLVGIATSVADVVGVGDVVRQVAGAASSIVKEFSPLLDDVANSDARRDPLTKTMEAAFNVIPKLALLDKPSIQFQPTEARLEPVGNLASGIRSEYNHAMRLDVSALTTVEPEHYPNGLIAHLSQLTRKYSYLDHFKWSSTVTAEKTQLWSWDCDLSKPPGNKTLLGYIADSFVAHQGPMKLRFDIVGTPYHTGLCGVTFVPFVDKYEHDQGMSSYYQVFDLREQRSFEFVIPYVHIAPFRVHSKVVKDVTIPTRIGTVKVFIENPLIPIQQVSPDVDVVVFLAACNDFHFTIPKPPLIYPQIDPISHIDDGTKETLNNETFNKNIPYGIRMNIGEDHELLPDLLSRWYKFGEPLRNVTSVNIVIRLTDAAPFFAKIIQMFRYWRGGVRILLIIKTAKSSTVMNLTPSLFRALAVSSPLQSVTVPDYSGNKIAGTKSQLNFAETRYSPSDHIVLNDPARVNTNAPDSYNRAYESTMAAAINDSSTVVSAILSNNSELNTESSNLSRSLNNQVGSTSSMLAQTINVVNRMQNELVNNTGVNTDLNLLRNSTVDISKKINSNNDSIDSSVKSLQTSIDGLTSRVDGIASSPVVSSTGAVVKVTSVPPLDPGGLSSDNHFNGFASQLVLTSTNQSTKLEVPFYTWRNYLDSWYPCFGATEWGKNIMGILLVESDVPIDIDMYISKADDATPVEFIGFFNPDSSFSLKDMNVSSFPDYTDYFDCLDSVVPQVGESKPKRYWFFSEERKSIQDALRDVRGLTNRVNTFMDKSQNFAEEVTNVIRSMLPDVTLTGGVVSAIIHLLQVYLNPSLTSVLLAIGGVLCSLGLIVLDSWYKIVDKLSRVLSSPEQNSEELNSIIRPQCECGCDKCGKDCHPDCQFCLGESCLNTSQIATIGSLVVGCITAYFGIKSTGGIPLTHGLFRVSSTFWTSITHSMRFLKDVITLFRRGFNWVVRKIPGAPCARLLGLEEEKLRWFISEVDKMSDMRNRNSIRFTPEFRNRFWYCVVFAYQIRERLLSNVSPEDSRRVLHLSKVCDRIIRLANDDFILQCASPVRYEPFMLCIEGQANIGKSFLTTSLLTSLLTDKEGINHQSFSNPIYYRTAGVEYWNGYYDQPVVVYDDVNTSSEPQVTVPYMLEMFNLKSTSIMNCNMASIEEKCVQCNPYIVAMLTNNPFWYPQHVINKESYLRRRDIVIKASLKAEYGSVTDVPSDVLSRYDHLEFRIYQDSKDEFSINNLVVYSFAEILLELKRRVRIYHQRELENVRLRYQEILKVLPEEANGVYRDIDPLSIFNRIHNSTSDKSPRQTGMLPSEISDLTINLLNEEHNTISADQRLLIDEAGPAFPQMEDPSIRDIPVSWLQSFSRFPISNLKSRMMSIYGWSSEKFDHYYTIVRDRITIKILACRQFVGSESFINSFSEERWPSGLPPVSECPSFRGSCYICLEESAEVAYGCVSDSAHYVCVRCVAESEGTLNEIETCGMCRQTIVDRRVDPIRQRRIVVWLRSIPGKIKYQLQRTMAYFNIYTVGELFRTLSFYSTFITYNYLLYRALVPQVGVVSCSEQFLPKRRVRQSLGKPVSNPYSDNDDVCSHRTIVTMLKDKELTIQYRRMVHQWKDRTDWGRWTMIGADDEDFYEFLDVPCKSDSCCFTLQLRDRLLSVWKRSLGPHVNANPKDDYLTYEVPPDYVVWDDEEDTAIKRLYQKQTDIFQNDTQSDPWFYRLGKFVSNYWRWILSAIAVVGALTTIYRAGEFFFGTKPQIISSGSEKMRFFGRQQMKPRQSVRPQVGEISDSALRRLYKGQLLFRFKNNNKDFAVRALALFGHYFIVTRHEWDFIINSSKISIPISLEVFKTNTKYSVLPDDWEKFAIRDDLVLVKLPKFFPLFNNILSLIPTLKNHSSVPSHLSCVSSTKSDDLRRFDIYDTKIVDRIKSVEIGALEEYGIDAFTCYDLYQTTSTKAGLCGSLYVSSQESCLIAFHTAGSRINGYATPLVREDFLPFLDAAVVVDVVTPQLQSGSEIDGNCENYGKVPRDWVVHQPTKTGILPSLINNEIPEHPPVTQPAILSRSDPRYEFDSDPLLEGCKVHYRKPLDISSKTLTYVMGFLKQRFSRIEPVRVNPSILTIEQSILGIPEVPFFERIKLCTSAGYPYNLDRKRTTKASYITIDESNLRVSIDPDLVLDLETKRDMRKQGIRPLTVWQDSLKDERRKERKLRQINPTRVFSCAPVDYLIEFRRFFLDFIAAYRSEFLEIGTAIGISVDGPEWTDIYNYLNIYNNTFCQDFKDFGPRLFREVVVAASDLMISWTAEKLKLTKEEVRQAEILCMEFSHSIHITMDTLSEVQTGIPSGHPATVDINDISQLILMCCAYVELTKQPLDSFFSKVRGVRYGDDGIYSVHPDISSSFNQTTVMDWFASLNFGCTTADKSDDRLPFIPLERWSFLKRGFRKHPKFSEMLAPIDLVSIYDCAQWVWKSPDLIDATNENIEQALRLAYGHGPQFYKEFYELLEQAGKIHSEIKLPYLSWEDMDRNFFSSYYLA